MSAGRWFTVACCGKRRGILPGGILICPVCDFDHDKATTIPNVSKVKDVPLGRRSWLV